MMWGSVYKRLSSYDFNGFIAYSGSAIEMHLMNSLLITREVEQHCTLNDSVAMIMVVHVEMDLMKLPT